MKLKELDFDTWRRAYQGLYDFVNRLPHIRKFPYDIDNMSIRTLENIVDKAIKILNDPYWDRLPDYKEIDGPAGLKFTWYKTRSRQEVLEILKEISDE